jgi:hypothetical protein
MALSRYGYELRAEQPGFDSQQVQEMFLSSTASRPRPAVRPTPAPVQWIQGESGRGVKLITHLHLLPSSWRDA